MDPHAPRTDYREPILALTDAYGAENAHVLGSGENGHVKDASDVDSPVRHRPEVSLLQAAELMWLTAAKNVPEQLSQLEKLTDSAGG